VTATAPLDLLAIGAHPDDADISCGGTLALAASQGFTVGILDLTRGEMGTNGTPEIRDREAAEAARILGLAGRWNAGLPDGAIHAMDTAQERAVVTWIRRLRPAVLLTHFPQDRHPDHIQASLIAERAWYLAGLVQYPAEGPAFRPKARWYFASRIGFHPSVVVDVTSTWEAKKAAILAHRSQVVRDPTSSRVTALNDPKFLVRIESRLRHFGSMIGVEFGEPFVSDMPLGVDSLASILGAPKPVPGAFTG